MCVPPTGTPMANALPERDAQDRAPEEMKTSFGDSNGALSLDFTRAAAPPQPEAMARHEECRTGAPAEGKADPPGGAWSHFCPKGRLLARSHPLIDAAQAWETPRLVARARSIEGANVNAAQGDGMTALHLGRRAWPHCGRCPSR